MLQATSVKIEEEKYCEIMFYFCTVLEKNKIKIIFLNISGKNMRLYNFCNRIGVLGSRLWVINYPN